MQNYRYGIDPLPTVGAPSAKLTTGSVGRIIDPNYRNPVAEEMNVGYSWQITGSSVLEADYVHVLRLHENKTIKINPKDPTLAGSPGPLAAAFTAAGQPVLSSVRDEKSIGRSRYDGLNISYRQRAVKRLTMEINYTLARAYLTMAAALRSAIIPAILAIHFRRLNGDPPKTTSETTSLSVRQPCFPGACSFHLFSRQVRRVPGM